MPTMGSVSGQKCTNYCEKEVKEASDMLTMGSVSGQMCMNYCEKVYSFLLLNTKVR